MNVLRVSLKGFGIAMIVLGMFLGIETLDSGAHQDMQDGGFAGRLSGLAIFISGISIGLLMLGVAALLEIHQGAASNVGSLQSEGESKSVND
ncbi:hypothetical protein ACFFIY_12350 [Bhargavaea ullalensis]|uniref:Uncharacterized protein n=1 Tax=Bhargavaea ullalensis TaxID=1265685 RepID=A0ABV2G891_9BACL